MSKINHPSEQVFNDYLARQNDKFKVQLTALRRLILDSAPGATELLSYQVHCFKQKYMLVGIGTTKDFCSLYTMSSKLANAMKDELKGCKLTGTTLHFRPDEPLPEAVISKIVRARMHENELIAQNRKKTK